MHVALRCDPDRARVWHHEAAQRLRGAGHGVSWRAAATAAPTPWPDLLLGLEARLRGLRDVGAIADAADLDQPAGEPDVILDLDGAGDGHGRTVWHLDADGRSGLPAMLEAAACGRTPVVAVRHGSHLLASGRIGSEAPDLLHEHVTDMLGRCMTLILAALDGRGPVLDAPAEPPPPLHLGQTARLAAAMVARRFGRRLYRSLYRTPHWRTGWRRIDGPDLIDLRRHPDAGWHDLPDDGHHFYADPFPHLRDGRVTLFVEDYVHATGRGCIAAVPFGPEGPMGRPEPVLERPYHLSYPFVFARDGDTWMIPETGEAGTIELYRSTAFPGGWVKEAELVTGLVASDATLHEMPDGRWWMFATVRDGGAASDALHLWSAPDFRGPWTAHRRNPVLVDIAAARPAGRMVLRDGALIRPVQDCRAGYGAALGFARVTRLDDDGFSQVVETIIRPGPRWPGRCLHTLNSEGGFEFIDGSARRRRPWRGLRQP